MILGFSKHTSPCTEYLRQDCLLMSYSLKVTCLIYEAPLFPSLGKSSNGENGYYQYIWACFNKWPVHRLHAS